MCVSKNEWYFPPLNILLREPRGVDTSRPAQPLTLAQVHRAHRRIGRELRAMEPRLEYRG